MEYLDYLIYPIAGLLCLLALGGLNTKHHGVVIASMISLALNGYAIIQLVWWPIPISIASDFLLKKILGDPGATPRTPSAEASGPIDVFLLSGFPLVSSKLQSPVARAGAQVFILGMVDMRRNAENLSYDDFVAAYDSVLARHDLSPSIPVSDFVNAIGQAASASVEIANLMRDGSQSIKSYIVEKDVEAVADLGRAVMYAEMNEQVFGSLPGAS